MYIMCSIFHYLNWNTFFLAWMGMMFHRIYSYLKSLSASLHYHTGIIAQGSLQSCHSSVLSFYVNFSYERYTLFTKLFLFLLSPNPMHLWEVLLSVLFTLYHYSIMRYYWLSALLAVLLYSTFARFVLNFSPSSPDLFCVFSAVELSWDILLKYFMYAMVSYCSVEKVFVNILHSIIA